MSAEIRGPIYSKITPLQYHLYKIFINIMYMVSLSNHSSISINIKYAINFVSSLLHSGSFLTCKKTLMMNLIWSETTYSWLQHIKQAAKKFIFDVKKMFFVQTQIKLHCGSYCLVHVPGTIFVICIVIYFLISLCTSILVFDSVFFSNNGRNRGLITSDHAHKLLNWQSFISWNFKFSNLLKATPI